MARRRREPADEEDHAGIFGLEYIDEEAYLEEKIFGDDDRCRAARRLIHIS